MSSRGQGRVVLIRLMYFQEAIFLKTVNKLLGKKSNSGRNIFGSCCDGFAANFFNKIRVMDACPTAQIKRLFCWVTAHFSSVFTTGFIQTVCMFSLEFLFRCSTSLYIYIYIYIYILNTRISERNLTKMWLKKYFQTFHPKSSVQNIIIK